MKNQLHIRRLLYHHSIFHPAEDHPCAASSAGFTRNIVPILVQGLLRLEYRGYDSCGVAVHASSLGRAHAHGLQRAQHRPRGRTAGTGAAPSTDGATGIAHTRWATHGARPLHNAHPHFSHGPADAATAAGRVALVHNGIIENHEELRAACRHGLRVFDQPDRHRGHRPPGGQPLPGRFVRAGAGAGPELHGAYAIAVIHKDEPAPRGGRTRGSPLILGVGTATGIARALPGQRRHGPGGRHRPDRLPGRGRPGGPATGPLLDRGLTDGHALTPAQRPVRTVQAQRRGRAGAVPPLHAKGNLRAAAPLPTRSEGVAASCPSCLMGEAWHGDAAWRVFKEIDNVLILACGTSYYSGCTAKYWLEEIAGHPTQVEVASEYRYRTSVPEPAPWSSPSAKAAKPPTPWPPCATRSPGRVRHTLTICNVATSAMVRECKDWLHHPRGVEIGVAAPKAFTTPAGRPVLADAGAGAMQGPPE